MATNPESAAVVFGEMAVKASDVFERNIRKSGLAFLRTPKKESDNMKKPMTMKQWEKSPADKKMDKKMGYREGSAKDRAADRKGLAKMNAKKGK